MCAAAQEHWSSAAARVEATAAESVHAAWALPIESTSGTMIIAKRFMSMSSIGQLRRGAARVTLSSSAAVRIVDLARNGTGAPVGGAVQPAHQATEHARREHEEHEC